MLTETVSGKCPCCGYDKLLQRYGSQGYYVLDGCARCGFGYGSNHYPETADNTVGFDSWAGYGLHILTMSRASGDVPYPEELKKKMRETGHINCQEDEDYIKYRKRFDECEAEYYKKFSIMDPEEQRWEIFKCIDAMDRCDDVESTVFSYEDSEIEEHKSKGLKVFE